MKNLFEPAAVEGITDRMAHLRPDSERQWGKMNVAQMLAHCSAAIGMAEGKVSPPRILLGRLLGPLAKKSLIVNGEPMRRNAMTEKSVLVADERDYMVSGSGCMSRLTALHRVGPGYARSTRTSFSVRLLQGNGLC